MKTAPWITLPALAVLTAVTAVRPERAQGQQQQDSPAGNSAAPATPPSSPKTSGSKARPPVHKPEQSALNQTEHDERAKKALEESRALLQESLRKEQAAKKESERLTKDKLTPASGDSAVKDPEKAVKALKDKITPEKADALKDQAKKTAKTLLDSDEAKKLIEETKKKATEAAADESRKNKPAGPAPSSAPLPPPTTFDTIPGPKPAAPAALPVPAKRSISGLMKGERIVMPPSMDPKHPQQKIRPEDPVGRTIVMTGNAQIKMPTMQVDADEIVLLKAVSESGSGPFDMGSSAAPSAAAAADKKKAAADGKSGGDSNGLESMIATGRVRVLRLDKGSEIHAKGNRMVYDQQKGSTTMTGWPSVQQDNKLIVAQREDAVIVLYSNEKDPYMVGCTVKSLNDPKGAQDPKGSGTAQGSGAPSANASPVTEDSPEAAATDSPPAAAGGKPASPPTAAPGSGQQRPSTTPRRPAGQSR
jgi:lipopolysaccharide export system protein LptA